MAIEMEEYQKIRQIKEAGELSQRAAAAELGLARNTVRKYWDGSNVPWERKPGSGRKKDVLTEDVVAFVSSCLEEDEKAHLKKQKHTARRIYNRLVHEKGFTGGESSVRALVAELRRQPRDAFIPLEYSPGEAVQVDWGEAVVWLAGKKTTLSLWCMRECCSDDFYCCAFYRQNEESFLEGMRNGFEYFGGVPRRIIFDNARVAVKEGFGLHAKATDRYLAMAAHYAFQPVFCNIASGHEKGLVEGLVGFIRRSTLVPAPHVNGIEELNDLLLKAAAEYRSHIIPGRERPVGDYVPAVREHLIPLPPYRYDPSRTQQVRVDEFSLVRFDHNRYSVPYEYSGKTVTVKGSGCRVTILYQGTEAASYERDYGRNAVHYRLEHYMELLSRKPRSICNAAPVRRTVPPRLMTFLENLQEPRELIGTLRLYIQYGEELLNAIEGIHTYDALQANLNPEIPNPSNSSGGRITSPAVQVVIPQLDAYNALLKRGEI